MTQNDNLLRDVSELKSQINLNRDVFQNQLNAANQRAQAAENNLQLCQVKVETLQEDLEQLESQGNIVGTVQERNR